MKQFLYLDTDIVNSIIAQDQKGLVTQQTMESRTEEKEEKGKSKSASGAINGGGSILKILKAQLELKGDVSSLQSNEYLTSSKDVVELILHDAAYDIAYSIITPAKVAVDSQEYDEESNYIELKRVYTFVDFKYLEELFSDKDVLSYFKKENAEKIEALGEQAKEGLNRDDLRKASTEIKKEVQKAIALSNKQYDEVVSLIRILRRVVPYDRFLISSDGYLIPLDEQYFRIDPTNMGFRYGGEITCVGMITNLIGEDCNPEDPNNVFATIQHSVNEVLRGMLPTIKQNLCIVHPIAVYYGD